MAVLDKAMERSQKTHANRKWPQPGLACVRRELERLGEKLPNVPE